MRGPNTDRVQFIRSCQGEVGFTLNDVRELFELCILMPQRAENLKPKAQKKFLAAADRRLGLIEEKQNP